MLDINIYNKIFDWTKSKLAHSLKSNNNDLDIYREIMPPNKTQAIVIYKNSFGSILETYIDGSSLISCEMNIVAVQKLDSYTENELLDTILDFENAISYMLESFNNNDQPNLQKGYSIKNIDIVDNEAIKPFDINTVQYSINVVFQITCDICNKNKKLKLEKNNE